jgi:hypothetical protein
MQERHEMLNSQNLFCQNSNTKNKTHNNPWQSLLKNPPERKIIFLQMKFNANKLFGGKYISMGK